MQFSDVIGQSVAAARLRQMVDEGRLPHALMLCGPHGSGKMPLALALASYLLGNSRLLASWGHPDLHFTFPVIKPPGTSSDHKMASDDFIKEWRAMLLESPYFTLDRWLKAMNAANQQAEIGVGESDALIRKLSLTASQGGYRVCVIWLPERMNGSCANKLLKLIEEPPQHTAFIMVSEEPEHLLETIRSRTQRIDIRRIATDDIEQALIAQRGIDPAAARQVARAANGSWLAALDDLAADNEKHDFLDMFMQLMRLAYGRKLKDLKRWSEAAAAYGREKQRRMLVYFLRLVRENFMYNFRSPDLCYMNADEEAFARKFAPFINEANVIVLSDSFNRAIRDIGQNANAKIVFFDIAMLVAQAVRLK